MAQKFSHREVSVFCAQVGMILKSGLPLYDGIGAFCKDMPEGRPKKVCEEIARQCENGMALSKAMALAGAFPNYAVSMVEVGEQTGKTEEVVNGLSEFYDKEHEMQRRLRSAVIYPITLFVMLAVVMGVFVIKILPVFYNIFKQLGGDLDSSSGRMMRIGMAAGNWIFYIIIALAVILAILFIFGATKKGKKTFAKFSLSFPLTRGLVQKNAARRFSSAMALMLSSGMQTEEAFRLVTPVVGNPEISKRVEKCNEYIRNGALFGEALEKAKLFPGLFARVVNTGSKTGNLDDAMKKLSEIYEDEAEASVNKLMNSVEPVLIGVLSFAIGSLLVAVMLPLVGIMSSIG